MRVPLVTRTQVIERADRRCESCGTANGVLGWSVHHRKPRGMGGTKNAASASPANLMLLCGSGITGCHGFYENNRALAREHGVLVQQTGKPSSTPVLRRGAWMLLLDSGQVIAA